MKKLKWTIAGKSDPGRVRGNNEDNWLIDDQLQLAAVADGMGGHQAGEVASRMAVELLKENLRKLRLANSIPEPNNPKLSLLSNQLLFCAKLANRAINEASRSIPQDSGMGTTLTALAIEQNGLGSIVHIGDSRLYLWRRDKFEQITKDHSLVMDQVRQGLLTKEEASHSRYQNILSRALGIEPIADIDAQEFEFTDGDMAILCSDGLSRMVNDDEIVSIIRAIGRSPARLCNNLTEAANAAGGKDNITVIVAYLEKAGILSNLIPGHDKRI
ncbi:MAG: Stp1/IreP family PP2C-type Ser/Thr phosphatase [Elusimicrobia bacterium]|nr:Stp1/IreP family PP2C-type Ser/Thr phosphatase [Elusimicrobiota bacterium]